MKTWLEKIRSKPLHKRNQIVWICAAIATLILVAAWIVISFTFGAKNESNFFETFNRDYQAGQNKLPNINLNNQ